MTVEAQHGTPVTDTELRVQYDPRELCFRTPGDVLGPLYEVSLMHPVLGECEFLLRQAEDDEREMGTLVESASEFYLRLFHGQAAADGDWECDADLASPGDTGIWTPDPLSRAPKRHESFETLFSIGEPPLGATRGSSRADHARDYRWVFVAKRPGAEPTWPMKRLTALRTELRRVVERPASWGRFNLKLTHSPELVLRLTAGEPRAVVLVNNHAGDPLPCRLRADLERMLTWVEARCDG